MFWQRRRDGRIYVYDRQNGKTVSISRDKIRHLDGRDDASVEVFVNSMRAKPHKPKPQNNKTLSDLVEKYRAYLQTRDLDKNTIENKTLPLMKYVFPFYLCHTPPLLEPDTWVGQSSKLLEHFRKLELSDQTIVRANGAFRGFWKWLREEGLVSEDRELFLRTPRLLSKATPLQFTLTPDQVIAFAKKAEPDISFMALVGFFCSLRPQEVFAISRATFRTGTKAEGLECCKVMNKNGLYARLAVHIASQKSKTTGALKEPKAHSKGWVGCFNEHAARMIIEYVQSKPIEGVLIPFTVDYNMKRWSNYGIPGITLKDLRRASLYWLGHYSEFGIVELRNHARHAKITTTDLYLRRPAEANNELDALDLDA